MKYTIKEICIINFQKIINALLLLRFKMFFWYIETITEKYEKMLLKNYTMIEDFRKMRNFFLTRIEFFEKWDWCFSWGSSNNEKANIIFDDCLQIRSKFGKTYGNWDGEERVYYSSTGHVSTKEKIIPPVTKVAAKIQLHKSNGGNQAFWLLDIEKDYIYEVDIFEYVHGKLLFTNHWGKSYKAHEHKQSCSSIKIDVSDVDLIYEVVLRKKSITWKINGITVALNFIGIPQNNLMLVINDTAPCEVVELPTVMRVNYIIISNIC